MIRFLFGELGMLAFGKNGRETGDVDGGKTGDAAFSGRSIWLIF